jgi:hypothetical protein
MGKTRAEIQKAYRERKGGDLKMKERERDRLRRANKSEEKKAKEKRQGMLRNRKLRRKKLLGRGDDGTPTLMVSSSVYKSRSSESRATFK